MACSAREVKASAFTLLASRRNEENVALPLPLANVVMQPKVMVVQPIQKSIKVRKWGLLYWREELLAVKPAPFPMIFFYELIDFMFKINFVRFVDK